MPFFFYRDQSYAYKWLMKRSLSSSFYFPRWSCKLPNLQTWQLCSCECEGMCAVTIKEYFSCWKHNVMNVTVVGVLMDHSCSRVLKILFDFLVSLYSCFNFLLLLNTSIEGNEKKTALEQICKWSVVLWKIPLRTPPGHEWVNNCTSRRPN